jgi:acyl carrier protein
LIENATVNAGETTAKYQIGTKRCDFRCPRAGERFSSQLRAGFVVIISQRCPLAGRPLAGRSRPLYQPRADGHSQEGRIVASVEERVIEIVCENLAVSKEQVNRNTAFIEDIGADSLDIVELIMELEEEFEITIPDDQAEKIKTVGEAIDYIQKEIDKK